MKSVKMVFRWPEPGSYIGGVTTVCNNYLAASEVFLQNGVNIEKFDYKLPKSSWLSKIKNSKLNNIGYGIKQYCELKRLLSFSPNTILHFHTSRKWLFRKDLLLIQNLFNKFHADLFLTIHVGDITTVFSNSFERNLFISIMNRCVKKTFFLSIHMMEQFIDVGLNPERCCVLYNYAHIEQTTPNEKTKTKKVVYLGSINREKGIVELLNASKKIKGCTRLYVCGAIIEPNITPLFEQLLKENDHVDYCGLVDYKQKNALLKEADILVLPSYREGMPISILEAISHSCAVITTPVGAIPEILKENENCIYVNPKQTCELEDALNLLLSNDSLLKQIQSNNFELSQVYSEKKHIEKLSNFYKSDN